MSRPSSLPSSAAEMPPAEALAELRAAGYEHAQIWRGNGLTTIYLNDGPVDARGRRTGKQIAAGHGPTAAFERVDANKVWAAIHRLVSGKAAA